MRNYHMWLVLALVGCGHRAQPAAVSQAHDSGRPTDSGAATVLPRVRVVKQPGTVSAPGLDAGTADAAAVVPADLDADVAPDATVDAGQSLPQVPDAGIPALPITRDICRPCPADGNCGGYCICVSYHNAFTCLPVLPAPGLRVCPAGTIQDPSTLNDSPTRIDYCIPITSCSDWLMKHP